MIYQNSEHFCTQRLLKKKFYCFNKQILVKCKVFLISSNFSKHYEFFLKSIFLIDFCKNV